jgi:hypothetical protein
MTKVGQTIACRLSTRLFPGAEPLFLASGYRGRIVAADSVEHLRDLMNRPSLEEIFSQLIEQLDLESVASDIVSAIGR